MGKKKGETQKERQSLDDNVMGKIQIGVLYNNPTTCPTLGTYPGYLPKHLGILSSLFSFPLLFFF